MSRGSCSAEKLVFVFPQWWFNVPAILKGFFDRVLVPGVAFDHASGGGPLIPRLTHVNALWVVSSAHPGGSRDCSWATRSAARLPAV